MKEAILYRRLEDGKVECFLCSHRCRISKDKMGFCGVRQNRGGVLYTLVYAKAIASHIDPIEKKPLFHFMPGSYSYSVAAVGCNFRCGFCQNWNISQIRADSNGQIPGEELSPEEIVKQAVQAKCQSISYTYTEPTIFFEYAYDTACLAKRKGLKNNFVTNGYQTPETIEKMAEVIDAANIDLKSFSDDFYRRICYSHLEPVLESIRNMYRKGIWVEVTTLVVPDQNDSEKELRMIAEFLAGISPDIPWHISRYHPDYQMNDGRSTPISTLTRARQIGYEAGLRYVYIGNVPGAGFEDTVCPGCKEVVIGRLGFSITRFNLEGSSCKNCGRELPIITGIKD